MRTVERVRGCEGGATLLALGVAEVRVQDKAPERLGHRVLGKRRAEFIRATLTSTGKYLLNWRVSVTNPFKVGSVLCKRLGHIMQVRHICDY